MQQANLFSDDFGTMKPKRTEEKEIDAIAAVIVGLVDPVILPASSWADTLPEWIYAKIIKERAGQAFLNDKDVATHAEALAYLAVGNICQPLDDTATRIYQYLLTREVAAAEEREVPEGLQVTEPTEHETNVLLKLRKNIYGAGVKERRKRMA